MSAPYSSPPLDRGRRRYRDDLARVLRRFGSLEAAYAWLRSRPRQAEFPPPTYWDDQGAGR